MAKDKPPVKPGGFRFRTTVAERRQSSFLSHRCTFFFLHGRSSLERCKPSDVLLINWSHTGFVATRLPVLLVILMICCLVMTTLFAAKISPASAPRKQAVENPHPTLRRLRGRVGWGSAVGGASAPARNAGRWDRDTHPGRWDRRNGIARQIGRASCRERVSNCV